MIEDGTSQTMMIAEVSDWCYYSDGRQLTCRTTRWFTTGSCCPHYRQGGSRGVITVRARVSENFAGVEPAIHSAHPGGAQVLFADGSVHFLTRELDIDTLYGLADRHDHRVLNQDQF